MPLIRRRIRSPKRNTGTKLGNKILKAIGAGQMPDWLLLQNRILNAALKGKSGEILTIKKRTHRRMARCDGLVDDG